MKTNAFLLPLLLVVLIFTACEKERFAPVTPNDEVLLPEAVEPMKVPPGLRHYLDLNDDTPVIFVPFRDTNSYEAFQPGPGGRSLDKPYEQVFLRPARPTPISPTAEVVAYLPSDKAGPDAASITCIEGPCADVLPEAVAHYQDLANATCQGYLVGVTCCLEGTEPTSFLVFIKPICFLQIPVVDYVTEN